MNANTNSYAVFKTWQVKQLGPKPTADQLEVAHAFGRPGLQSLALAMAMRDQGVTGAQIQIACGAPQNNHRRGLISEGLFKREGMANNDLNHTVYKITLTAKGTAAMKRINDAKAKATAPGDAPKADKAKPAKVKAATKRKPRAKPAPAPVSDAPAVPDVEFEAGTPGTPVDPVGDQQHAA